MLVTMKSSLSEAEHTLDLPVTQKQLDDFWKGLSGKIQEAFPLLSPSQREFILTGITQEEWDDLFKEPEDYDFTPTDDELSNTEPF